MARSQSLLKAHTSPIHVKLFWLMLGRRFPYPFTVCLLVLFRSGNLYKFSRPAALTPVMSRSIKNFFSVSATTEEGPRKKTKTIETISSTTVETLDTETPTPSTADDSVKETSGDQQQQPKAEGPIVTPVPDIQLGWPPFDAMEPGWKASLAPEFSRPYFKNLLQFLTSESKTQTVYPPTQDLFSAFNLCPLDHVKVVVIGQDPYHGPDQAHGLSFSVRKGVAIPPSLKNMILEARNDPKVKILMPTHGNLESWSKQGVLMLNAVLTVRKGDANSHQKKGWEEFTDAVVRVLSKKQHIVYLLWGKPAQLKCTGIDPKCNTLITTSHPSPLGAYKTDKPFMGSRCFSRCNEALEGYGKEPIDWTIR